MKKSEQQFIVMALIFIFGLTNLIPTKISVYDQYIIPIIQENTTPDNVFFFQITFLIVLFRILILIAIIYEARATFKYGIRYNVFGLRDLVYK